MSSALNKSNCESRVGYPIPDVERTIRNRQPRIGGYKDIEDYEDDDLLDAAIILNQLEYHLPDGLVEMFGTSRVYKAIITAEAGITAERYRRGQL